MKKYACCPTRMAGEEKIDGILYMYFMNGPLICDLSYILAMFALCCMFICMFFTFNKILWSTTSFSISCIKWLKCKAMVYNTIANHAMAAWYSKLHDTTKWIPVLEVHKKLQLE